MASTIFAATICEMSVAEESLAALSIPTLSKRRLPLARILLSFATTFKIVNADVRIVVSCTVPSKRRRYLEVLANFHRMLKLRLQPKTRRTIKLPFARTSSMAFVDERPVGASFAIRRRTHFPLNLPHPIEIHLTAETDNEIPTLQCVPHRPISIIMVASLEPALVVGLT